MSYTLHYDSVLDSIAGKFFNDLPPTSKPEPQVYVETIKQDLLNFTDAAANDPAWMLWTKVQERRARRELCNDRNMRMSQEELSFLAESALHLRTNGHIVRLRMETLEHVSACKIDGNIAVSDLVDLGLPDYIWFEWPSLCNRGYEPWISRTIGIFVSRFVLLDAPRHRLVPIAEPPIQGKNFTLELMRALAQNVIENIPCAGYQVIVVQQNDHGYRYITCMFGHECSEQLTNMLALQKEMSDQDHRKRWQTEQVWSNVAIRLLLFAAHQRHWLKAEHPVFIEEEGMCALKPCTHTFFATTASGSRNIGIRPNYRSAYQPFVFT